MTAWEKAVITDINKEPKSHKRLWQTAIRLPQGFTYNDWSALLDFLKKETKERVYIKKHSNTEVDLFVKKGNPKKQLTKTRFLSFFNNYLEAEG